MDFQRIACFLSVAQYLNFSKAAKSLYMTQSSVTQQIKTMQDELGSRVFERDNRSVHLTPAGALLKKDFSKLIQSYRYSVQKARSVATQTAHTLMIGYPNPPGWGRVAEFVGAFHQSHPEYTIGFRLGKGKRLLEAFRAGMLAVMFGNMEYVRELDAETCRPLFRVPTYVLIPRGHPLEGKTHIPPKEINRYKTYSLPFSSDDVTIGTISNRLIDVGIDYDRIVQVAHREEVEAAVYASMGLGLVPGTLSPEHYHASVARLDAQQAFFEVGCIWKSEDNAEEMAVFLDATRAFSWPGEKLC